MAFRENLARFNQAIKENPDLDIDEIQELIIDTPDDEIRGSSQQFLTLCHTLTEALVKTNRSVSGINLMSIAILKFQNHRSQLTPLHSDFCLLCLNSKCLNPALKFLDLDYTEIKKTDDKKEDVKRLLLFYYYGGLIYAALKNFERASYHLEVVLTIPASVMNPIMQETYKKYVILGLLLNGKPFELPRYTSQCVLRHRKQAAPAYLKLAQEYSSLNYDKIHRLIESNASVFIRDENMGLVKQCLRQVHRRNIKRLTKTFLTLPLRDVASYVGLASDKEAELYILNMIDDDEITAVINQKDGMVEFQENIENFDTVAIFHELQRDMSVTTNLINILKRLDPEPLDRAMLQYKISTDTSLS